MKIIRRGAVAAGAVVVAVVVAATAAGCGLSGLAASVARPTAGHPVTLTQNVAPSALITVTGSAMPGPALAGLLAATARPREDLDILRAHARPETIIASTSPAPAKIIAPGQPSAPGHGETSFQSAGYDKRLNRWHGEIAAARQDAASRTRDAMSAWLRELRIPEKMTDFAGRGAAGPSDLAAECALAASALAGLEEEAGNNFGGRRVILLYPASLGGRPPAGEMAGDEVIVITPFLPTAAAASAAQAVLLGAGAAQAAVLGPEATAVQLARLVTAGLSQQAITERLSGSALFANGRADLRPGAVRGLTRLLAPLRQAGATAIINGYASAPGPARINYQLSYARAAAVAGFLEVRGIPASSLIIVGHGASDLIAPGSSGANRRVTVVIEEPASGRS